VPKEHYGRKELETNPQTGERYFGMRERTDQLIDPESPTAGREFEIQQRGGAYSDRIIHKPHGPTRTQRMKMRRTQRA
jgi:hypothetical protein